jgi:hypothetical protein
VVSRSVDAPGSTFDPIFDPTFDHPTRRSVMQNSSERSLDSDAREIAPRGRSLDSGHGIAVRYVGLTDNPTRRAYGRMNKLSLSERQKVTWRSRPSLVCEWIYAWECGCCTFKVERMLSQLICLNHPTLSPSPPHQGPAAHYHLPALAAEQRHGVVNCDMYGVVNNIRHQEIQMLA